VSGWSKLDHLVKPSDAAETPAGRYARDRPVSMSLLDLMPSMHQRRERHLMDRPTANVDTERRVCSCKETPSILVHVSNEFEFDGARWQRADQH
jgi:hypothetical protein